MLLPSDGRRSGKEITMYRRRMRVTVVTLALAVCASASAEQHLREATARKTAAGHEVNFVVEKPVDVTVRIIDTKGEVVRHLASGMVGLEKAAAPFAPKTLSQKVLWDGKDDEGKPVDAEGCSAVVLAGMKAKFDKFLCWNPDSFASLVGGAGGAIAVGPGGKLYVLNHMSVHYALLRIFDREGKYLKSLWPFNPALPKVPELYKNGWGMQDYEGNTVPVSVNHAAVYFYSTHANGIAVDPDGVIVGDHTWDGGFWVMNGEYPYSGGRLKGAPTPWLKGKKNRGARTIVMIAVGPEGDFYMADAGALSYSKTPAGYIVARLRGPDLKPVNAFTYSGTKKLDTPRYYLGTIGKTGDDESHFESPGAVAVTPDGTIWVGDRNAVKVYRKDGMFLKRIEKVASKAGEVPLKRVISLAANLKSGEVYINVRVGSKRKLLKLKSYENPSVVAEYELSRYALEIAVDSEANIIWVQNGGASKDTLLRLQDKGTSFEARTINGRKKDGLCFPRHLAVDKEGRVYVNNAGYGVIQRINVDGSVTAIARLGGGFGMVSGVMCTDAEVNFYLCSARKWGGPGSILKYGPNGKRLKFGDKDSLPLKGYVQGIGVASNGDIYVAVKSSRGRMVGDYNRKYYDIGNKPYDESLLINRVDVYGPDGTLKKEGIVKLQNPNGVALARDGSIYTVETYIHHGAQKKDYALSWGKFKGDRRYRYSLYDKLLKFPPQGGKVGEQSALWIHRGISGTGPCNYECAGAQVLADADDRVWCHDAAVYNGKALDAAGNLMLRVGVYGNEDSKGGGGDRKLEGTNIIVDPEIPLARPSGVAVWRDVLFISDEFSGRIVRCRLEYANRREIALNP